PALEARELEFGDAVGLDAHLERGGRDPVNHLQAQPFEPREDRSDLRGPDAAFEIAGHRHVEIEAAVPRLDESSGPRVMHRSRRIWGAGAVQAAVDLGWQTVREPIDRPHP